MQIVPPTTPTILADLLSVESGAVTSRWLGQIKTRVAATINKSDEYLIDHLPDYLIATAAYLRDPSKASESLVELAFNHGENRARSHDYAIEDLLVEFAVLNEVILDLLPFDAALTGETVRAMAHAGEVGVKYSTRSFLEHTVVKTEKLDMALKGGKLGTWSVRFPSGAIEADDIAKFLHNILPDDRTDDLILRQIHPEDRERIGRAMADCMATDALYDVEYRVRANDGAYRWVYARGETQRDAAGNLSSFSGVVSDITDKKLTESLLHFERHKLKSIFELAPSPMALLRGRDLVFEMINPTYAALLAGREIIERPLLDVMPELAGTSLISIIHEVFATGRPYFEKEMPTVYRRDPAGPLETRYFENSFTRIVDATGRPFGVLNTSVDVTDRVLDRRQLEESERKAEASERRLKDVLLNGQMGAWEIKYPEGVVEADEHFRRFHGGSDDERIEASIERICHPDDRDAVRSALQKAIDGHRAYAAEYRVRRGDDGYVWVAARGQPRYDEDGRITSVSGVAFEIEEQKKTEFALANAKQEAERANDAKSAFLANISHEIRTPLGAITGFSDLARQKGATRAEIENYLAVVERNSVQVLRIIDDVLDLAKVEAGRVTLEIIEVDVPSYLADFSSLMAFRARDNGIDFKLTADADVPRSICTDPTRLRQVLTNAVGNAIKFTSRGRVRVHVSYHETALHFAVIDTGRGISEDQTGQLFQAFAQADVSTTRKYGGTGLGLVLTRKLCRLLGGDYVLKSSKLGVGSEFVATIRPRLPRPTAAAVASIHNGFKTLNAPAAGAARARLDGVRILLVEDSPDNQILIQLILQKQGATMAIANDGAEGVKMATAGEYDIVLMDIQMPTMDGHEATRMLRMMGFDKPIVALTAHAMKEEADRAAQSGFTTFLSKPIQREALINVVRELVRLPVV